MSDTINPSNLTVAIVRDAGTRAGITFAASRIAAWEAGGSPPPALQEHDIACPTMLSTRQAFLGIYRRFFLQAYNRATLYARSD